MNTENRIEVVVEGQTYIKVVKIIGNPTGLEPIVLDIKLRRGIVLEGRVTNRATGRPVRATVRYYPFRDNPHLKEYPDASFFDNGLQDESEFRTDDDGHFRAVVLPDGGILAVRTSTSPNITAEPLDQGSRQCPVDLRLRGRDGILSSPGADRSAIRKNPCTRRYQAWFRGSASSVQIVGPDGRPVAGSRAVSIQIQPVRLRRDRAGQRDDLHPSQSGESPRPSCVIQESQGLGASVNIKGDESDPIRVVLRPLGTVTGRLVDEEGKPRPKIFVTPSVSSARAGESELRRNDRRVGDRS